MTMLRFHHSGAPHIARLLPLTALALGLAWTSPAEAQDQPTRSPAPAARKAPAQKKTGKAPAAKTKAPAATPAVDAEDEAAEAPADADEPSVEPEEGDAAAEDEAADEASDTETDDQPRVVITHKEVPVEDEPAEAESETKPAPEKASKKRRASTRAKRNTAVPPAYVLSTPKPEVLEYTEGGEIPPGYEMGTRARKGLVIGGAVTLGAAWLLSSAAATLLIQKREEEQGSSYGYRFDNSDGDVPNEAALYIPLAGPWIALGNMDGDLTPEGRAALVADGVVQAAGLAMFIGGLAARQKVLVRTEEATVGVAAGVGSAWMTGSF